MDYLSTIQKYMDGKKYAYQNIRSSDNNIGYVTATGVSKKYASMDVYNATAGKNNCPSSFTQITPTWSDLGFPVGTLMKSGQSCGNENTYVQASPPENQFDWEFYIRTYSPQGVSTQQQALNHWNSTGKQSGLLPNATIMTSMSKLGKVGYIDVDTQFHTVPTIAKSSYKSYTNISNVTGTTMEDCSRPIPSLKYGDIIVFTNQSKTGYINNSVFKFGTTKTNMYIRPPPGENQQGKAIKYGDTVCIASSASSSNTSDCGWWGCSVASVNTRTNQMEFGPGGSTTTTFKINPPEGSNYTSGSEIKYGYPFSIITVNNSSSSLNQNSSLYKGNNITSANGLYKLTYQSDGNVCLYNTRSSKSIWCSTATHSPGRLTMQDDGNLVAYDSNGKAKWATGTNGRGGVAPYTLTVKNDRNVVLTDSTNTVLWSTQTQTTTNSTVDNTASYAYVSNNVVKFGSWNETINKNVFSVQYTPTTPSCDINKMKELCTDDCVGFIHSPDTHTWQKIRPTSTYKITSTVQDVYLKEYDVNLQDRSCTKTDVKFIDPTLFSNYPQGTDFETCKNGQCKVLDSLLEVPTDTYIDTTTITNISVNETLKKQHEDTHDKMKTKTAEYENLLEDIQQEYLAPMDTLEQQYQDMSIFDKQHKMQLVLWAILSASILAIVLIRK